jgi:hypothetical protein
VTQNNEEEEEEEEEEVCYSSLKGIQLRGRTCHYQLSCTSHEVKLALKDLSAKWIRIVHVHHGY